MSIQIRRAAFANNGSPVARHSAPRSLPCGVNDATIIGAGPAGSAAALCLARARWAVTLIEQHRFPRDKVCGECLSALGLEVLDRLQLGAAVRSAGALLVRAQLHAGGGRCASLSLPRPMVGLSRHRLDGLLLQAAAEAGARLLQPVRCEKVEPGSDGVALRLRDLSNNRIFTQRASYVLVADGKSAQPGPVPPPTGDIGIKSHWTNVDGPRDAIELFACRGCYGGLAAIEDGRWNAAFSVPARRLREHGGNIPSLFAELLSENRSLHQRLRHAVQALGWLAAPTPRFALRRPLAPRIIQIGNAAAAIEPIGGEGMGLALASAELAAHRLIDGSRLPPLRRSFTGLWRTRQVACRTAAVVASSPPLAAAAVRLTGAAPALAGAWLHLMGKYGRTDAHRQARRSTKG